MSSHAPVKRLVVAAMRGRVVESSDWTVPRDHRGVDVDPACSSQSNAGLGIIIGTVVFREKKI